MGRHNFLIITIVLNFNNNYTRQLGNLQLFDKVLWSRYGNVTIVTLPGFGVVSVGKLSFIIPLYEDL
jgi:hypothetical protein